MTRFVITGEGATIEAHGSNVQAPSKDIPVADLVYKWFGQDNCIQIGWVNFLKEPPTAAEILARIRNAPYREDVAISPEEVRILGDAGVLDRSLIAPSYIGHYASHRIIFESAEPPQSAACPGEIPISELRASLEFSRATHQATIQRSIVLERERDEARKELAEMSAQYSMLRERIRQEFA